MSTRKGTAAAAPEATPEQGSGPAPEQPDVPPLADDADAEPDAEPDDEPDDEPIGGWIVFDNAAGERERVSLIEYRERGL